MPRKEPQYEIVVIADTNDADYITKVSKLSKSELEVIKPLITAIKKFKPYETKVDGSEITWRHEHNYPMGEYGPRTDLGEKFPREIYNFPEEVFELFECVLPYGEYGIHTITSVEVTPFVKKKKLL